MKINVIFVALLFLALAVSSGCIEKSGTKTNVETFSAGEFLQLIGEYNRTIVNETKHVFYNFTSLKDGEEVLVKDTIHNLTYHPNNDYTSIYFITDLNSSLPFSGDLTQKFSVGDKVEIDLHIIREVFGYPSDPTWTISLQTIEEGWDKTNYSYTPFSSSALKKV